MIRCTKCNRTLEEVQKQDDAFSLNYGESFMCNRCREREESENYWNGMKILFKVEEKDKEIAKLKLALSMATKEAFGNRVGIVVSDYDKRITNSEEYAEYLIWKATRQLKENRNGKV